MKLQTGLIVKPPSDSDYIFGDGKLGDAPIVPDGQWTKWIPALGEQQNLGVEPDACTSWGTLACVETLINQQFGAVDEFSKRFLAYVSGTRPPGNNPGTVAETLRTKGVVSTTDWPYTINDNTLDLFYAPPPQPLYIKALEFVAQYAFGYSWVLPIPSVVPQQQKMMDALQYSPLGCAGFAWEQDPATGYYFTPPGEQPCHWFMVYGYVANNYWLVFDSYTNDLKKLAWDYQFGPVLRYTITANVANTPAAQSAWSRFLLWINKIVALGHAIVGA